jgi:hypothetical protein
MRGGTLTGKENIAFPEGSAIGRDAAENDRRSVAQSTQQLIESGGGCEYLSRHTH